MKIHIHNSEKSGIEINERENFHIYFHWHIIIIHLEKFHRNKIRFLTEIYKEYLHVYLFSNQKSPCTIFQHYHPGTFISFAMENLILGRLFICSRILKPSWHIRGDISKGKSWDFFFHEYLTKVSKPHVINDPCMW